MGLRVNLLDIVKRLTKFDKKLGIINNGVDNNYPERIERFINNSVTAKTCANIMATYLVGNGFGDDIDKTIVSRGVTLQKFTKQLAKSFSKHRGAFIHINYNANYKFDSFKVLPYSHCRKGKKDDNKYSGKIIVYDNWSEENGKVKKDDFEVIDVFNNNEKVIDAQVEAYGGWKNYKGQIWYVNLDDEYDYSLSTIDAVTFDCDSESQSSIFKNKSLRKGFFGKTLIVTKPLIGSEEDYNSKEEYVLAQNERENFKKTIEDFVGAENVGGALHFEMESESDNLDDTVRFENISSDIDDKLFEYTESSTFKNILMAFNNIPQGLVRSDSTMFSQGGESLKVMREIYQDNTKIERNELEQVIQKLMSNFKDFNGNIEIIPLVEETQKTEEPKQDDTIN